MRRIPSVLAATSAFLLLAAVPARASGCPMLVDPTGDGRPAAVAPVSSPLWDVLSADVATGPTTLVAVLRLAGLPADPPDSALLNGTAWRMGWTIGTARHSVELRWSFGSLVSVYSWSDGAASAGTAVPVTIDRAGGTLSWTVPRAAVPGLSGATLSGLAAQTLFLSGSVDQSFTLTTYTDGTPGCVSAL